VSANYPSQVGCKIMNRLHTDFLVSSCSFLVGVGSVADLSGGNYRYNTSEEPDSLALGVDFAIVGHDFRDAMVQLEAQEHVTVQMDEG